MTYDQHVRDVHEAITDIRRGQTEALEMIDLAINTLYGHELDELPLDVQMLRADLRTWRRRS